MNIKYFIRLGSYILLALLVLQVDAQNPAVFNIRAFGAKSDGKTDNARPIQAAIDACNKVGGGRVLVPAGGIFMAGPFNLKSNIELYLESNATLLANANESVYTKSAFRLNKGEGTIWIGGENLVNLTIAGKGTIDGNGISFMGAELEDSYVLKPFTVIDPRPHLLTIVGGRNIRIRDLTVRNAAYWTIHLVGCDDVAISGISLLNSLKVRNSDGIDLDHSKNVRIDNCFIQSGDDCICLKNRREYEEFGVCENIVVNNCTMSSRSCAIKIGSENMDSIRHVLFNNCVVTKSNRGVGIQNRDEGTVTDVIFSNMIIESHLFSEVWWGKAEPIYVTSFSRANGNNKDANWRFPRGATEGRAGRVSGISFSNIKCRSESGIYVGAESNDKVSDIYFDQVDLVLDKTSGFAGGYYDRRPSKVEGIIKNKVSGFLLDTAGAIIIRNCSVAWGEHRPDYYAYALQSRKVAQLQIINLSGDAAFPGLEAIRKD